LLQDEQVQQLLHQVTSTQAQLQAAAHQQGQQHQQTLLAATLGLTGAQPTPPAWLAGTSHTGGALNIPPAQQQASGSTTGVWPGGQGGGGSRLPLLQQLHGAPGEAAPGYPPPRQPRSFDG
jgi:hypothetical protein